MHTVAETLYESLESFSPSEKKIARALLSDYPTSGLDTVASLATASHTSPPTVIRFIARLGFDGFGEFQEALRSELRTRTTSPLARAETTSTPPQESDDEAANDRARIILETFQRIPRWDVDALVDALCSPHGRVYLAGGQFSGYIAHIMQVHLSKLRPDTVYIDDPLRRDLAAMSDLRRQDLIIFFDVRRYEDSLLTAAQHAAKRKAKIALFTDQWLSPIAALADIVLPATVDVTFLDSLVGVLALSESITYAVSQRLENAIPRMRRIEDLR